MIHIEQQWLENLRTIEGGFLHEKAHEGTVEKRGNIIISRGLQIYSATLGIRGVCDVVEFHKDPNGVPLSTREGLFQPIPVEYKRGMPKDGDHDLLQLCAQAMCLEEMLLCSIPVGYVYYGETKKRLTVQLGDALREQVRDMLREMHDMYHRRFTPKVKPAARCKACSLSDVCLPILCKSLSVDDYLKQKLGEIE